MLEIRDLHATIDGKLILKGISLNVKAGEVHAVMGPNGSGKSTLAQVLAGHPAYEITSGEVLYKGENLLEMAPERVHPGGDDAERVDVEARIRLVEHRQPGLEHRHLEDLVPLLLAPREARVHRA